MSAVLKKQPPVAQLRIFQNKRAFSHTDLTLGLAETNLSVGTPLIHPHSL